VGGDIVVLWIESDAERRGRRRGRKLESRVRALEQYGRVPGELE